MALAESFPEARFHWLDIEEHAEAIGDLDVENFPTLFIQRGDSILFYGTMLPHLNHLRRLIETYQEQTPAQSHAYARSNPERLAWQTHPDLTLLREFPSDD